MVSGPFNRGAKMMATNFYQAYKRHWEDANYLFGDRRWPNADQLYMVPDPATGNPPNEDMVHIDKLWTRYETYRAGAAGYLLPGQNPFNDWHASQRYADGSLFSQSLWKNTGRERSPCGAWLTGPWWKEDWRYENL
jgi:hypothetical protein